MKAEHINVRAGRADDAPFVLSTWLKSYQKGGVDTRYIHHSVFFPYHRVIVENILTRDMTKVRIACDKDGDSVIYGYLVFQDNGTLGPIVHYIFVKEAWRNLGVATTMLQASNIDPMKCYFTHYTRDRIDKRTGEIRWRGVETLLRKWPAGGDGPGPIYCPYLRG